MTGADVRHRFPGVRDGWARFDGPAGTQMVDVAIRAAGEWSASGNNANTHGAFAAANATDDLLERARGVVAQLLDADPQSVVFGANMTTLTFAFTRAVARTLQPGDRVAIVEDTVTRGTSLFEAVEVVRAFGATPVFITVIVDRGGTCEAIPTGADADGGNPA